MAMTPQTLEGHSAGAGSTVNRVLFILLVGAALVLFPPLASRQPWHESFVTYFIAIVLEAVPYILIGSLLAGVIELFMPATLLPRLTKRLGLLGIPATALIAPAFPACECGVLAVARGLLRKGLPLPHTITYLIAGPILNPTVLFTTWLAFQDMRYPLLRALGGLLVAVVIGYAMTRVDPRKVLLPKVADALARGDDGHGHDHHGHDHGHQHGAGCADDCGHDHAAKAMPNLGAALAGAAVVANPALRTPHAALAPAALAPVVPTPSLANRVATTAGRLSAQVIDHFLEMAAFFLMGVFIAAAMKTWFGAAVFADLGTGLLVAPLTMMLAAFIFSLCAEADAFVAASFTEFSMSSQLAFLVFGPMFDIKLFLMYRVVFTTRFILSLAAAMTVLVLLYAVTLSLMGFEQHMPAAAAAIKAVAP